MATSACVMVPRRPGVAIGQRPRRADNGPPYGPRGPVQAPAARPGRTTAMTPVADPVPAPYAELAELAGGFIHEIKNHLSTLGLNLQLLAEDFGDPQTQRERRALDRVRRLQGE